MRRRQRKALAAWEADTRQVATETARGLALDLYRQRDRGVTPYTVGVVLEPGETAWAEVPACFRAGPEPPPSLPDSPPPPIFTWLVTSARVVGRLGDDRLYGWRWDNMLGCRVDLRPGTERISLDPRGASGPLVWSGPGVAPLAVATVYHLHGPQALVDHPGLLPLRGPSRPAGYMNPSRSEAPGGAPQQ